MCIYQSQSPNSSLPAPLPPGNHKSIFYIKAQLTLTSSRKHSLTIRVPKDHSLPRALWHCWSPPVPCGHSPLCPVCWEPPARLSCLRTNCGHPLGSGPSLLPSRQLVNLCLQTRHSITQEGFPMTERFLTCINPDYAQALDSSHLTLSYHIPLRQGLWSPFHR